MQKSVYSTSVPPCLTDISHFTHTAKYLTTRRVHERFSVTVDRFIRHRFEQLHDRNKNKTAKLVKQESWDQMFAG